MKAEIRILTTSDTILVIDSLSFDPTELPYGAYGYRFNGSSHSTAENLNAYWQYIDEIFLESEIETSQYVTLLNITVFDDVDPSKTYFYGVSS